MDIKYLLQNIELHLTNDVAEQIENARRLQLSRSRLLYSRFYNANTLRVTALPYEYIVLLNYIFELELQIKRSELAELDHIIYNDIVRLDVTSFLINNI